MHQRIVIVDDYTERTTLMARALQDNGYGVVTVQARNDEELRESVCRLRPDFLVIGDEVIIDLQDGGLWPPGEMPKEIKIAC